MMTTQRTRWLRLRDLFEQAMVLPVEQRSAFAERSCANDPLLRDDLQPLLTADVDHTRRMFSSILGEQDDAAQNRHQQLLGTIIGPYRLEKILGRGGAGTVYLAERIDSQYSAQVAVKIVESAAFNAEISRRFRAERQILANLSHPNIARLVDAGETPEGLPYLVMEYVHGEPIDQYCDRLQLSLHERINIVLEVCAAVQYAHQNLIVHRDIKPNNILVTPDGTPKLLDFGIAKLLDANAEVADLQLTRMNDRLLTPEYASPEQILGQHITTSSDVYTLGVVLYELLTGLRPYEVAFTSQLELERTICAADALKPSVAILQNLRSGARVGSRQQTIGDIAAARQLTPMRLRARLQGDLDAILLRALRKETLHRYRSIEQLADDLRRHSSREAVSARQGNWWYGARRFARKYAFAISITFMFVVLLSSALVVSVMQARRIAAERDNANRQRQTSDAVANFMVNVFEAADPSDAVRDTPASELLATATQRITDLADQPAVKARLLEALGRTYNRQSNSTRGVELLEASLALRKQLEGENPALASTLIHLGKAQGDRNDFVAAEKSLRAAMTMLETSHQTHSSDYAYALMRMGGVAKYHGNLKEAISLQGHALELFREIYGPNHPETAMALSSYASARLWDSDYVAATELTREAVDIYERTLPELHPDRMSAELQLGGLLITLGRWQQADSIVRESYEKFHRVFRGDSPRLMEVTKKMLDLARAKHDFAAAEQFARESLQIGIAGLGEQSAVTGQAHESLGIVLWQRGKFGEAEREFRIALKSYGAVLPADHLFIAVSEHFLAESLLAQGRVPEAIEQLNIVIARLKRLNAIQWRIARSESTLAQCLLTLGKPREAEPIMERSYQSLATSVGVNADTLQLARTRLEAIYVASGAKQKLIELRSLNTNKEK